MKLGIFGSGSLGKEILSIISSKVESWEEVFFIDDIVTEREINGIKVYRYQEVKQFSAKEMEILIAVGEPYYREKIYLQVKSDGYNCATFVSDSAYIAHDCKLANGCVVFPNTYMGVNVSLEENVIIHAGARIESDCNINRHSFISSGAFIGADTRIGRGSFVGPNSSIKDHLALGDYSVIGMGAVVIKDVENEDVVVGNPAHFLKKNISKKVFNFSIIE